MSCPLAGRGPPEGGKAVFSIAPDLMATTERALQRLHTPPYRHHLRLPRPHLPTFIEVAEMEAMATDMLSNDELSSAEQAWELQQATQDPDSSHSHSPHESPTLSPTPGDSADHSKLSAPIQKRRRVTRACDGMRPFSL
jgi:hypothetical protein